MKLRNQKKKIKMIINSISLFILSIDLDSLILVLFTSVASLGLVTIFYSRKKLGEKIITAIGLGAGVISGTDAGLNIYDRVTGGKNNSNNNNGGSSSGNNSGDNNSGSNEGNKSNEGSDSNNSKDGNKKS